MKPDAMLIYASLTEYEGKQLEKMTKDELIKLNKQMLNEIDFLVTTISQEAQNINPKYTLPVALSLALVPLVCCVDKYIQVSEPKSAKAYRRLAMRYLAKLTDIGILQLEAPTQEECESCNAELIMVGEYDPESDITLCNLCAKRIHPNDKEKIKQ